MIFFRLFFLFFTLDAMAADVEISTSVVGSSCDLYLDVKLVNQQESEIVIPKDQLPWENSIFGLQMFLYDWNEGVIVGKQIIMFNNKTGPTTVVSLKPNQGVQGKVRLQDRFKDFGKILKEKNLTLYWIYSFESMSKERSVKTGAVFLKKCA